MRGLDGARLTRSVNTGLVHGLHALPGRDLAGAPRDVIELPDFSYRADGHGDGERVAARADAASRINAFDATRLHLTMTWVVSLFILSAFIVTRYMSHTGRARGRVRLGCQS